MHLPHHPTVKTQSKRPTLPLKTKKLLMIALLGISLQACGSFSGLKTHIENASQHSSSWVEKNRFRHVQIETELEGNIRMNNAETDILAFPSDSSVFIDFKDGDGSLEIKAERSGQGELEVSYKIDGKQVSREQVSDARLTKTWQYFFRRTGVSANIRIQSIIKNAGINGVINEIKHIDSSSVTRRYIDSLVSNHAINNEQMLTLIDLAADISSNQNSKQAFWAIFNGQKDLSEEQLHYLLKATDAIESSSNLRDLLTDIVASERFAQQREQIYIYVLEAANSIESNSNLKGLLKSFVDTVDQRALDKQVLYIELIKFAGDSIESNSNLSDVFIAVLNKALSQSTLQTLIETAGQSIESNSNLAKVNLVILEKDLSPSTLALLIKTAANTIESSSQLAKVLSQAMQHKTFDKSLGTQMRDAINQVSSSSNQKDLTEQLLDISIEG